MGLGSEILFRIPDPGVKEAPDPDPQHCCSLLELLINKMFNYEVQLPAVIYCAK
jgi:hypothetical protein